jgi:hypothetical protein
MTLDRTQIESFGSNRSHPIVRIESNHSNRLCDSFASNHSNRIVRIVRIRRCVGVPKIKNFHTRTKGSTNKPTIHPSSRASEASQNHSMLTDLASKHRCMPINHANDLHEVSHTITNILFFVFQLLTYVLLFLFFACYFFCLPQTSMARLEKGALM